MQDEYANLLNYLKTNNFDYFITAGNVSEIYGTWHQREHLSSAQKRHKTSNEGK